jgi:hypothetical protein
LDLSNIRKVGVFLTSFSTWGTENILAEINLESTGGHKVCNIFSGQKLANTCSFVGWRIIVQQEKKFTQLSLSQILFQNPKNYSLGDVQRFCYHS